MATVTVRDLRYHFPKVEALLRQGEEIRITKRGEVIARLAPELPKGRYVPDYLGQLKEIYEDRVCEVTGAETIRIDRDRY